MNSSFSDETSLRKYLLGKLGEQDCEKIEEQLLSNEEFAKFIDLIEDEIIDEYIDKSLPPRDQQAFEAYFLRPPARQSKLKFAQGLRSQLREGSQGQVVAIGVSSQPRRRWIYWGASGAIAAMLLLTASLGVYTAKLRRSLETEAELNRKAQKDLAQEQARAARFEKEAEKLRNQINAGSAGTQSKYFTLALSSVLTMDSKNSIPVFRPHPGIAGLNVEIPLVDLPSQPYHVSLLAADTKELWSSRGIVNPSGDELIFLIPYTKWQPGEYSVKLTGTLNDVNPTIARCFFRVSR